ncbi:hypothetical protein TNCT_179141 [Trichonephila clavata]|uniref:Uncharacterized protein n=1 Tax=Trichonephila clavata TaxID=2740835 RepID=A0A8X6IPY2_TRICU|nr:hypothetical protein TNCT_179141 [Trichonephila clavata]
MTLKTDVFDNTDDFEKKSLKRYLLLESLVRTSIPQEIRDELEDMTKPTSFEIVIGDLSEYLFYGKFEKIFSACAVIFASSDTECAKFLLSRCLRLCHQPELTYFNFLLVAAFLRKTVFNFYLNTNATGCFTLLIFASRS